HTTTRRGHVFEPRLDLRGESETVQLLLPLGFGQLVVHHHDHVGVQPRPPADHDLPVDQTLIDPEQKNGHDLRAPWVHTRSRHVPSRGAAGPAPRWEDGGASRIPTGAADSRRRPPPHPTSPRTGVARLSYSSHSASR